MENTQELLSSSQQIYEAVFFFSNSLDEKPEGKKYKSLLQDHVTQKRQENNFKSYIFHVTTVSPPWSAWHCDFYFGWVNCQAVSNFLN